MFRRQRKRRSRQPQPAPTPDRGSTARIRAARRGLVSPLTCSTLSHGASTTAGMPRNRFFISSSVSTAAVMCERFGACTGADAMPPCRFAAAARWSNVPRRPSGRWPRETMWGQTFARACCAVWAADGYLQGHAVRAAATETSALTRRVPAPDCASGGCASSLWRTMPRLMPMSHGQASRSQRRMLRFAALHTAAPQAERRWLEPVAHQGHHGRFVQTELGFNGIEGRAVLPGHLEDARHIGLVRGGLRIHHAIFWPRPVSMALSA